MLEPDIEDRPFSNDDVLEVEDDDESKLAKPLEPVLKLSVPEIALFSGDDNEPDNNSKASKSAKFAVLFVDLLVSVLDEDDADGA